MIKISMRGLAKFIEAGPATQRRILREFKYPDDDEPTAMRLYYRDACERIFAFHKNAHPRAWLREKAEDLSALAGVMTRSAASRLKNNSRALRQYEANFGGRTFVPMAELKLHLLFGEVRISVVPDLVATEAGKERIVKFDFSKDEPSLSSSKIVSQCMFEAAKGHVPSITSSSVLYLDVPRGREIRGARASARTLRDIEAACRNIEALWPTI